MKKTTDRQVLPDARQAICWHAPDCVLLQQLERLIDHAARVIAGQAELEATNTVVAQAAIDL